MLLLMRLTTPLKATSGSKSRVLTVFGWGFWGMGKALVKSSSRCRDRKWAYGAKKVDERRFRCLEPPRALPEVDSRVEGVEGVTMLEIRASWLHAFSRYEKIGNRRLASPASASEASTQDSKVE